MDIKTWKQSIIALLLLLGSQYLLSSYYLRTYSFARQHWKDTFDLKRFNLTDTTNSYSARYFESKLTKIDNVLRFRKLSLMKHVSRSFKVSENSSNEVFENGSPATKITPYGQVSLQNSATSAIRPQATSCLLSSAKQNETDINKNRLILAWTGLTSRKPLWGITSHSFRSCAYQNCEITGNRSELDSADLVLFRIRELKRNLTAEPYRLYVYPLNTSDLPPYHNPDQLWMELNQESPVHSHADEELQPLNGFFNISSTYLLDSDFSLSYIPGVKHKAGVASSTIDYSKGKTKMALWFVSHCDAASGRDAYVRELQKYNITIDIFGKECIGKCSGISDGCAANNLTCYRELRQKYKFYLAFENSICSEYITEKFWNTLTSDSYNIPIALGARLEEYTKFAPPNSFLHTRNFTSVRALAELMHRVDGDRELFNSFHKWRETHEIVPHFDETSMHCYMCKQANEKCRTRLDLKNLSKYWSRKMSCDLIPEPIR
ncbi:4-galactosyl-N-acetylglucosaminide 3-alpha-L-fucosyltransferase FUT6-like [Watersipora subatra]|uniref:4-galactosyl-N-acetylglucosaminide 3-alpha-L-fucosyltransferase FUT6-like n=1 Tax=Watersipora subatra TaxID=2589382 RepID=UPI00355BDABD